jgi:hypothetical protein
MFKKMHSKLLSLATASILGQPPRIKVLTAIIFNQSAVDYNKISNYSALPVTVQIAVKIVLRKAKNVSLQV